MVIGNLSVVYAAAAIALLALVAGTPFFWRLAAPVPRGGRVLLTSLACLGVTGLAALPVTLGAYGETALFALLFSAILQLIAMPVLALLPRRA